jgi:aspartate/methionine/tyrosine aminotransferase
MQNREGASYAFPDISQVPMDAEAFADYFLGQVGMAALPPPAVKCEPCFSRINPVFV